MSVLVTGVGFVGAYAVRDLIAAGEDVVVYGFLGGNGDPNGELPELDYIDLLIGGGVRDRVKIAVGDVGDLGALTKAAEQHNVTKIMHYATLLASGAEANPYAATVVNVMGTANVFEAAVRLQMDKVVYTSSTSVFGPRSIASTPVVDDGTVFDPEWSYGAAKLFGEKLARSYADSKGLNTTAIRPSRIYGFGEHVKLGRGGGSSWLANLLYKPAVNAGPTEVPFGHRSLDFLYVEDLIATMVSALDYKEPNGTDSYLITGDYRPIREAVDFVRTLLPDAQITLKDEDLDLAKGATMIFSVLADSSRASEALGYRKAHNMEAGIFKTINGNRRLAGLPEVAAPEHLTVA